MRYRFVAAALMAATVAAGCGEQVRRGRSPAQVVIVSILSARGTGAAVPTTFGSGPLLSDVPDVGAGETVFDDFGQVTMRLVMRDPGNTATVAAPTPLNEVTITSYRVEYRRTDGRNTPGIDVPFPFTGALTITVGAGNTAAAFELVRHVAKLETPLAPLSRNSVVLTVIADVTFFGRDQAGNAVSATGSIQINFANFA